MTERRRAEKEPADRRVEELEHLSYDRLADSAWRMCGEARRRCFVAPASSTIQFISDQPSQSVNQQRGIMRVEQSAGGEGGLSRVRLGSSLSDRGAVEGLVSEVR